MARCPECGGSLGPVWLFRTRSTRAIRCRWCRAAVAISRTFSLARDVAVVLAGSGGAIVFLIRWLDHGWPVDLLAAALAPLLAVGAGWVAEAFAPLVTIEPRDLPHWARRHSKAEPEVEPGDHAGRRPTRSAVG